MLVIYSYDTPISDNCGGCNKPCYSMTRMGNCTKLMEGMWFLTKFLPVCLRCMDQVTGIAELRCTQIRIGNLRRT
jgi:hypothetical protein